MEIAMGSGEGWGRNERGWEVGKDHRTRHSVADSWEGMIRGR